MGKYNLNFIFWLIRHENWKFRMWEFWTNVYCQTLFFSLYKFYFYKLRIVNFESINSTSTSYIPGYCEFWIYKFYFYNLHIVNLEPWTMDWYYEGIIWYGWKVICTIIFQNWEVSNLPSLVEKCILIKK